MGLMVCADICGTYYYSINVENLNSMPDIYKNRLFTNTISPPGDPFRQWKIALNFIFWVRLFSAMSLTELVGPTMRIMFEMTQ